VGLTRTHAKERVGASKCGRDGYYYRTRARSRGQDARSDEGGVRTLQHETQGGQHEHEQSSTCMCAHSCCDLSLATHQSRHSAPMQRRQRGGGGRATRCSMRPCTRHARGLRGPHPRTQSNHSQQVGPNLPQSQPHHTQSRHTAESHRHAHRSGCLLSTLNGRPCTCGTHFVHGRTAQTQSALLSG